MDQMKTTASTMFQSKLFSGHINWFPGHMAKAVGNFKALVAEADGVLEVRDARIPFTSAKHELRSTWSKDKPHLVVFHKADLANPQMQPIIKQRLEEQGSKVHFCSTESPRQMKQLMRSLSEVVPPMYQSFAGSVLAIFGIPNVGKSTIINSLRHSSKQFKTQGATTGAKAGLTRHFKAFQVSRSPPVFIIDSPGILQPKIETVEDGLKLSLTGAIREAEVPYDAMVELLLHHHHSVKTKQFPAGLGISKESVPVETYELLHQVGSRHNMLLPGGDVDCEAAARYIVGLFREGKLGRYTLDEIDTKNYC
eukprot:gb/GECG01005293.1/.p1 GENE.gb/GECG01005293.1/~~gb/GECG01005293.1/.p1  ORF type:complete len:309 (+),score=33.98 gb/GECG01005293.1/:1-927(+)